MPSTNKTPNIGLSLWADDDWVSPDDWNADHTIIDHHAGALSKIPYVDSNGNWYIWDVATGAYVDSGVSAVGQSVAGYYPTLADLQTAYPDGDGNNAYLVDTTIYVWAGDGWYPTGVDLSNYYTKAESDTLLDDKADAVDVYTKSEIDLSLAGKANGDESGNALNANQLNGHAPDYYVQSNQNLLINGDFSKPVNQRGQTTYTAGYSIDRWNISGNGISTLSIEDGYIHLTTTGTDSVVGQYIENGYLQNGNAVTVSAMVRGNYKINVFRLRDGAFTSYAMTYGNEADWKLVSATGIINDIISTDKLLVAIRCNDTASSADFKWIKLELGDHATPLTPCLPGEELALCQRYGLTIGDYVRARAARVTVDEIQYFYPTPVTLRTTPTIANPENLEVRQLNATGSGTGWTFSVVGLYSSGIVILASKPAHGVADGYLSSIPGSATTFLDAEIY